MKRLIVLGGGESGVGAAILGARKGYKVFLSDAGVIKEKYQKELKANNIEFEHHHHTAEFILAADVVVKSPGIPQKAPIIQLIKDNNIPVISEIEFAASFTNAKIIAITGSNGKTTTTSLVYYILAKAGLNVAVAGNIGTSFARMLTEKDYDYYVLELSSFQLDNIDKFRPHIAIILNITPDHLDQYNYQFELYAQSKFKITQNQTNEDFLIYNFDDPTITDLLKTINTEAKVIPFSNQESVIGAYADKQTIHFNLNKKNNTIAINSLALSGSHNVANSMAAAIVANILNVKHEIVQQSLSEFKGVEHRLEKVLKIKGIQFINDSKATNIDAAYYALESMKHDTIWIVGGVDKGNNYTELIPLVREKVKAIICLGLDNEKIISTFESLVPRIIETNNMIDAVQKAYEIGVDGDNVLLSPCCASFDLFENYEDRGLQFKVAVKKL